MIAENFAVIGFMVFESIEYKQTNIQRRHIHYCKYRLQENRSKNYRILIQLNYIIVRYLKTFLSFWLKY